MLLREKNAPLGGKTKIPSRVTQVCGIRSLRIVEYESTGTVYAFTQSRAIIQGMHLLIAWPVALIGIFDGVEYCSTPSQKVSAQERLFILELSPRGSIHLCVCQLEGHHLRQKKLCGIRFDPPQLCLLSKCLIK